MLCLFSLHHKENKQHVSFNKGCSNLHIRLYQLLIIIDIKWYGDCFCPYRSALPVCTLSSVESGVNLTAGASLVLFLGSKKPFLLKLNDKHSQDHKKIT